jgi:hypothetical protein
MSGKKLTAKQSECVEANAARIIHGRSVSTDDLLRASPIKIPKGGVDQIRVLLEHAFAPDDCVEFVPAGVKKVGHKPSPISRGTIIQLRQLESTIADLTALLESTVGMFLRINPVDPSLPGPTKAANMAKFPHLLLEHDHLPKEKQAALLASLELPIVAIIDSGGKSLHAWLRTNVRVSQFYNYRIAAVQLMALLKPLGFDSSNSDASRLSRAPGFPRKDDPTREPTLQRLLYLNPKVRHDSPPIIEAIESSRNADANESAHPSLKAE